MSAAIVGNGNGIRLIEPPGEDDRWRDDLIMREVRGQWVPSAIPSNVVTILRHHPAWRGVIAYDAFAESIVSLRSPSWSSLDAPARSAPGPWSDSDSLRAVNWLMREERINVPLKAIEQSVPIVAETNRVHPVRDYLKAIVWDQQPRLDRIMSTHFGADDTPYARGVGARWMISAVARIARPGCQVDCTLLLESPQGFGKTSGFRELVPEPSWYSDTGISIGDKDSYQQLRSIWIYGLDELDSLRRGEITRTKNFLTATRDRYRPSYARRPCDFPRQNVFCGTTNESSYLSDSTGNRRFWPVRLVRRVDVEAIRRDRDQLWAEAAHRFRDGERWHVDTPEFRSQCEAEQEERTSDDPWVQIIGEWLEHPTTRSVNSHGGVTRDPLDADEGVTTTEVCLHGLGFRDDAIKKSDEMRVAECLRVLGWARGPLRREAGKRVRRFRPAADLGP